MKNDVYDLIIKTVTDCLKDVESSEDDRANVANMATTLAIIAGICQGAKESGKPAKVAKIDDEDLIATCMDCEYYKTHDCPYVSDTNIEPCDKFNEIQ